MRQRTVLITAVGGPTGYGIARCLRDTPEVFVVGVDISDSCPTRHMVDAFRVVPRVSDPRYLSVLEALVNEYEVDLVYPTLQQELVLLYSLTSVTHVAVNPPDVTRATLDKVRVYDTLSQTAFAHYVPRHRLLAALEDLPETAESLGYPAAPLCLKPTSSHGGIGFKVIASEARVSQQVAETGRWDWISLREAMEILSRVGISRPLLLMEYLPGDEYSVDVFLGKRDVRLAIPRRRQRTSTGVVIEGMTVENPELIESSLGMASALGLTGFCNVQFRYDNDNEPKVIDVNPRFCGSQVHSYGAGVNFPLLALRDCMDEPYEVPSPTWGVTMKRYWEIAFFGTGTS